jgi:hypothetical protein
MDPFHDGASRQRPKILPKLAFHGSAGLAAIICAGLVGHFMVGSDDAPTPAATSSTAQIYEIPAAEPIQPQDIASDESFIDAGGQAEIANKPLAEAPIPPKPTARPVIRTAAPACGGGECEPWESVVNKALAAGPAAEYRPAPTRASVPRETPPIQYRQTGTFDDLMPPPAIARNLPSQRLSPAGPDDTGSVRRDAARPDLSDQRRAPGDWENQQSLMADGVAVPAAPIVRREGPTSIGEMAKSATTSAAVAVVTQSSRLVDNLVRWGESVVPEVGIRRDHTPPEPLPY